MKFTSKCFLGEGDNIKYSIGEFSDRLGITADTIRLYEKYGIIQPIKDHKNNYRYFDDIDARSLLMSRWYRSLQIPLPDVSALMTKPTIEDIIENIERSEQNLSKEINKITMLLQKINEIKSKIIDIKSTLNTFKVRKLPGIYRIKQTDKNSLLKTDFPETHRSWMSFLPFAFFCIKIIHKEFIAGERNFKFDWGLAITENELDKIPMQIDANVEYFGPKTYLSTVTILTNEELIMKDSLKYIIDYLNNNHYSVDGDIIGKLILTEKVEEVQRSYIEFNVPIKIEE